MGMSHTPLYHNYLEDLSGYTDAEFGRLMRALLSYVFEGDEPRLGPREELVWPMLRGNADRALLRYDELRRQRSEAGQKGAEARWGSRNG